MLNLVIIVRKMIFYRYRVIRSGYRNNKVVAASFKDEFVCGYILKDNFCIASGGCAHHIIRNDILPAVFTEYVGVVSAVAAVENVVAFSADKNIIAVAVPR